MKSFNFEHGSTLTSPLSTGKSGTLDLPVLISRGPLLTLAI